MEWTTMLRKAIGYMEDHLLDEIGAGDVAEEVNISPFYLSKGFKVMTGYSIGEYVRCRRLYLAALDIIAGRDRIIDLSYKYGYDTPESFTKAFSRFHGMSPMQMKKTPSGIKTFLPLQITVSIKGGNKMDFVVEKMEALKVIGFERVFSYEEAQKEIPKFWDEFMENCQRGAYGKETERILKEGVVGMYGICIDDMEDKEHFRYMIAGNYLGCVPEGMRVFEIPAMNWAKFACTGPMPGALQSLNNRIYEEWLPGNTDWEMAEGIAMEWYSCRGDMQSSDYESAIWIPVKSK